jgi:hypothetical protein
MDGWMDGWREGDRARARKIISITCRPACRHRRSIVGYKLLALLRAYEEAYEKVPYQVLAVLRAYRVVSIKWPPNQALASPQATV